MPPHGRFHLVMRRREFLCAVGGGAAGVSWVQEKPHPEWVTFPGKEWETITPAQAGFDEEKFERIVGKARPQGASFGGEKHDGNKWGAALARGGCLVRTWGDPDYRYQTASVGKGFTWAALGLAVDDGLIDPNQPIRKHWTGEGQFSHPHKRLDRGFHKTLTWAHLLRHRGGFPITGGHNWKKGAKGSYAPPPWAKCTGDPMHDNYAHVEPGKRSHYSSGGFWRLSQALTALWKKDLKRLLDERLFRHMGIPADRWDWVPGKVVHDTRDFYPGNRGYGDFLDPPYEIDGQKVRGGGGWVVMSAKDLARFGLLVATRGIWKGKRLIGSSWIRGHAGGNGSLTAGDRSTFVTLGIVTARGVPGIGAFNKAIAGPVRR